MEKLLFAAITSMAQMEPGPRLGKICLSSMVASRKPNGLTPTTKSFLFLQMKTENIKFNKIVFTFGHGERK